jgi:hypothetical protein
VECKLGELRLIRWRRYGERNASIECCAIGSGWRGTIGEGAGGRGAADPFYGFIEAARYEHD